MSDVDDYMSDNFLPQVESSSKLVSTMPRDVQRKFKSEAKHKEDCIKGRIKPQRVLQQESREAGLEKALGAENKGFALLQKMGYKPGMPIGKKGNEGIKEPIGIKIKTDRGGLGQETELKRRKEEIASMRTVMMVKRRKMVQQSAEDYRAQRSAEHSNKQSQRDLYSSQKTCLQLDSQKEIEEPSEPFFWPASYFAAKQAEESEEDENELNDEVASEEESEEEKEKEEQVEFSVSEKLEILTLYLRNQHYYCIWCGTGFDDKEDLKANCPGNTSDAHD